MTSIPRGSANEHILRLIDQISEYDLNIRHADIVFCNIRDISRIFGADLLEYEDNIDFSKFLELFDYLMSLGTEWINISGDGFLNDGRYLCIFDFSKIKNRPVTVVEISGPNLSTDGVLKSKSSVIVGLLEKIANHFIDLNLPLESQYIRSKCKLRSKGKWENDKIIELTESSFQVMEKFIQELVVSADTKSYIEINDKIDLDFYRSVLNNMLIEMSYDIRSKINYPRIIL